MKKIIFWLMMIMGVVMFTSCDPNEGTDDYIDDTTIVTPTDPVIDEPTDPVVDKPIDDDEVDNPSEENVSHETITFEIEYKNRYVILKNTAKNGTSGFKYNGVWYTINHLHINDSNAEIANFTSYFNVYNVTEFNINYDNVKTVTYDIVDRGITITTK